MPRPRTPAPPPVKRPPDVLRREALAHELAFYKTWCEVERENGSFATLGQEVRNTHLIHLNYQLRLKEREQSVELASTQQLLETYKSEFNTTKEQFADLAERITELTRATETANEHIMHLGGRPAPKEEIPTIENVVEGLTEMSSQIKTIKDMAEAMTPKESRVQKDTPRRRQKKDEAEVRQPKTRKRKPTPNKKSLPPLDTFSDSEESMALSNLNAESGADSEPSSLSSSSTPPVKSRGSNARYRRNLFKSFAKMGNH